MHTTYKKIILTSLTITAFFLYGAVIVFATPPTTKYAPGEILDPACAPLDPNCSVTTGWEFDIANNYLFNTTDKIGIGINPVLSLLPDTVLNVNGPTIINNEYSVGNATTLLNSDGYIQLGHHNGDMYGYTGYDSSLIIAKLGVSFDVRDMAGTVGARAGLSIKNDMDSGLTGEGIYGVMEAKANENTSKRYGFSFWAGGSKDSADHYEYDPVLDLDTKGIFVQHDRINMNYLYNITNKTNYLFHSFEIKDDGFQWKYGISTINSYNSESNLKLDSNLTMRGSSGSDVFKITNNGSIYSKSLEGGTTPLSVDANGNIIRSVSDEKLKTNIESLDSSLARVMQLNPVSYNWKDPERFGEQLEIGFIAQEIEIIVPEVVRSGGEYKSVNYQVLTALNAGAIKELALQINERALKLIDNVKEIFVRKVTTDELCVGDRCVTEQQFGELLDMLEDRNLPEQEVIEEGPEEDVSEGEEVIDQEGEGVMGQEGEEVLIQEDEELIIEDEEVLIQEDQTESTDEIIETQETDEGDTNL